MEPLPIQAAPFPAAATVEKQMKVSATSVPGDMTPPSTRSASPTSRKGNELFPNSAINSHARSVANQWDRLQAVLNQGKVVLDGESLDIPSLVAVARHGTKAELDQSPAVLKGIQESVAFLEERLANGEMVYGVNTGFGGSADTRTSDLVSLQRALVQHQGAGVLTSFDIGRPVHESMSAPNELAAHSLPTSWVRGTMLTRVNSIIRGHSAVTFDVINSILTLIEKNLTPVIPLRSSISASGDLSPLSYIAGTIEGNPDIYVRTGPEHEYKIVPAPEALKLAGLRPVRFAAKEGLGLLNGTAVSCAAASLALHETNQLAFLSQALTAMACEALLGTAESFHPFISNVRPHRGQREVAQNITSFLNGSRLARGAEGVDSVDSVGLAQDRYPLRTSSQWIGPQLEDLLLATEQVTVELNSTTDNPLIDVAGGHVHHGGNFQAASITSAMEKARLSLQMMGKLLFSQATEMINPAMNKGLPPNLAADDPSLSFTCKGIDIAMASYMSELAFLANPVSSHVQSAEMHNQAVNSLALISARYTMQAVELLSLMSASYLFVLCQALDLRVLQLRFFADLKPKIDKLVRQAFGFDSQSTFSEAEQNRHCATVWSAVLTCWDCTTTSDLSQRTVKAAEAATQSLLSTALAMQATSPSSLFRVLGTLAAFTASVESACETSYTAMRRDIFQNHTSLTPKYLGRASGVLYAFVREQLGVSLHRGLVEHPLQPVKEGESTRKPEERRTIGRDISTIYESLRDGRLFTALVGGLAVHGGVKA